MNNPEHHPFFTMLKEYHALTPHFPFLAFGLGFAVMVIFFSSCSHKSRISLIILSFFWAWNGLVLFTYHAAALFPKIYAVQGVLFPVQALLLARAACAESLPDFSIASGISGKAGLVIMFTALFLYPVAGNLTGHAFPAAPVFPEPCPLTIFTFGYLLSARGAIRPALIVIPFFWSLMGIMAVIKLGVVADAIEVITGIGCSAAILIKNRSAGYGRE